MPAPQVVLPPTSVGIHFEGNGEFHARPVGAFLEALQQMAEQPRYFGREAQVEIISLRKGSLWMEIGVVGLIAVAANLATIGQFASDIAVRLKRSNTKLGLAGSEVAIDGRLAATYVLTSGQEIIVLPSEMRAIPVVAAGRDRRRALASQLREREESRNAAIDLPEYEVPRPAERLRSVPDIRPARDRTFALAGQFTSTGNDSYSFESLSGKSYFALPDANLAQEVPTQSPVMIRATRPPNDDTTLLVRSITQLDTL